jgi:hypothetical protein
VTHRWSGWPGAWCLDCGISDWSEEATCCRDCDIGYPGATEKLCEVHQKMADASVGCPEPNSRRHDPYVSRKIP